MPVCQDVLDIVHHLKYRNQLELRNIPSIVHNVHRYIGRYHVSDGS